INLLHYRYGKRSVPYMNVGDRIKYFRNQKQFSVNKLANLAGISQSYLRDIELGNKNPTVEILSYICEALDITLCDFFNETTIRKLEGDALITKIYQLNSEQKQALLQFLETIL
ncbi:MAG: helix-turn-helix domain-containing protein, partial [Lachnospiraceae bacterium]|nr:helix-turn-helix domain-containing protein [Lachnospiraceae bacterium]